MPSMSIMVVFKGFKGFKGFQRRSSDISEMFRSLDCSGLLKEFQGCSRGFQEVSGMFQGYFMWFQAHTRGFRGPEKQRYSTKVHGTLA